MRFTYTLIIIIFNTSCLFSQDEKKLSKKEANEEVKRLTILIENLELENNELNNKLMIEYEKLLSEMDQNSNLRIQNGEFRDEIRGMQEQLLEQQKSFSKKESEIEILNNKISNYKTKLQNDSISLQQYKILNKAQALQFKEDSLKIKNLSDSIAINQYKISNLELSIDSLEKSISKTKENTVIKQIGKNEFFNHKKDLFNFLLSVIHDEKKLIEETKKFEEYLKKEEAFALKDFKEKFDYMFCMDIIMSPCGGCGKESFLIHSPSNTFILINEDKTGDFETEPSTKVLLFNFEEKNNGTIFINKNVVSINGEEEYSLDDYFLININESTSINNTGDYIFIVSQNNCSGNSNNSIHIYKQISKKLEEVFQLNYSDLEKYCTDYANLLPIWSSDSKSVKVWNGTSFFTIKNKNGKWNVQ